MDLDLFPRLLRALWPTPLGRRLCGQHCASCKDVGFMETQPGVVPTKVGIGPRIGDGDGPGDHIDAAKSCPRVVHSLLMADRDGQPPTPVQAELVSRRDHPRRPDRHHHAEHDAQASGPPAGPEGAGDGSGLGVASRGWCGWGGHGEILGNGPRPIVTALRSTSRDRQGADRSPSESPTTRGRTPPPRFRSLTVAAR